VLQKTCMRGQSSMQRSRQSNTQARLRLRHLPDKSLDFFLCARPSQPDLFHPSAASRLIARARPTAMFLSLQRRAAFLRFPAASASRAAPCPRWGRRRRIGAAAPARPQRRGPHPPRAAAERDPQQQAEAAAAAAEAAAQRAELERQLQAAVAAEAYGEAARLKQLLDEALQQDPLVSLQRQLQAAVDEERYQVGIGVVEPRVAAPA
jgi:hypothetical protein